MIAKGEDAAKDPLSIAGNIDSDGNLVGEPGVSLSALTAARPGKGVAQPQGAGAGSALPPGSLPASGLRRGFAARATTIGSHAARAALSAGTFGQTASSAPKTSAFPAPKDPVTVKRTPARARLTARSAESSYSTTIPSSPGRPCSR